MALVITQGSTGDSGSAGAAGPSQVIASGKFGSCKVDVFVTEGGGVDAWVYTFDAPGAVALQSVAGTTVSAAIRGSLDDGSIDVAIA